MWSLHYPFMHGFKSEEEDVITTSHVPRTCLSVLDALQSRECLSPHNPVAFASHPLSESEPCLSTRTAHSGALLDSSTSRRSIDKAHSAGETTL